MPGGGQFTAPPRKAQRAAERNLANEHARNGRMAPAKPKETPAQRDARVGELVGRHIANHPVDAHMANWPAIEAERRGEPDALTSQAARLQGPMDAVNALGKAVYEGSRSLGTSLGILAEVAQLTAPQFTAAMSSKFVLQKNAAMIAHENAWGADMRDVIVVLADTNHYDVPTQQLFIDARYEVAKPQSGDILLAELLGATKYDQIGCLDMPEQSCKYLAEPEGMDKYLELSRVCDRMIADHGEWVAKQLPKSEAEKLRAELAKLSSAAREDRMKVIVRYFDKAPAGWTAAYKAQVAKETAMEEKLGPPRNKGYCDQMEKNAPAGHTLYVKMGSRHVDEIKGWIASSKRKILVMTPRPEAVQAVATRFKKARTEL